jgi:hypothetical protein
MKRKYHATFWRGDEEVLFEHPIRLEETLEGGQKAARGEFFVNALPGFELETLHMKLSDGRGGEVSIKSIDSSSAGSHFILFEVKDELIQLGDSDE